MLPDILRYFYDKIFPKPNGEDYTKTEVILKILVIWLPLFIILIWAIAILIF